MGIVGGSLGYRILKSISSSGETNYLDGSAYEGRSKIEVLFGANIWEEFRDKTVIDFGCGCGGEAVEIASQGAALVTGIDLRESVLDVARRRAAEANVSDRCRFTTEAIEPVDVIFSMDGFEHYSDPPGVLKLMRRLLKDDGKVIIEFGPPWYHPLGGHPFSIIPWAHLLFTERSLIRWRSDFKKDGVTRLTDIDGGLNKMSVKGFEKLIQKSEFEFASFEAVPIHKVSWFSNALTREFLTSIVRCTLTPRKVV